MSVEPNRDAIRVDDRCTDLRIERNLERLLANSARLHNALVAILIVLGATALLILILGVTIAGVCP